MADASDVHSFHLAIAPIDLTIEAWIAWRRGFHAAPGPIALDAGGQADDRPWVAAIEAAFLATRRLPGRLERLAAPGGASEKRVWKLSSAEFGPCILVGVANAPPALLQSAVVDDIVATMRTSATPLDPTRTHLVSVYYRNDARRFDLEKESSASYLDAHRGQEANAKNDAMRFGGDVSTLGYAHVGFSYTTFAAGRFEDVVPFLPTCCMAQSYWAVQGTIGTWLRGRAWEREGDDRVAALSRFERIKVELKLFELERSSFRDELGALERRLFARFVEYWKLEETNALLEEVAERISAFLAAKVKDRATAANDRQSGVLFAIAVLGILGLAGTLSAYGDLLHDVPFVSSARQTPLYTYVVLGVCMATILGAAFGVYLGRTPKVPTDDL